MHDVPDEHVVDELRDPPQGVGRGIRAAPLVRLRQGDVGVREPVELEMVRGIRAGIEVVHDVVEWFGSLDGVEGERRHALERHVDEDAESAEPQRDRREHLGVLGLRHGEQLAVGVTRVAATTWVAMPP
jgi:hypothetical protein